MFKYSTDPVSNAIVIIDKFIDNKFPYMTGITNNKIFHTDVSTSTLTWVEDNVVFELYFMHPNTEVVTHSHPFKLTSIFLDGQLRGWIHKKQLHPWISKERFGIRNQIHDEGTPHGFIVGENGSTFYTIQIWNHLVTNPKSATEEYLGEPLGPIHAKEFHI